MPSKSDMKGPNIILIVLDTLGTKHMSCYGYSRETCPRMTKYAQKGVLFENAYANDVPTHPSFYSIFSGQRGITTGVVSHDRLEIPVLGTPWFPEILSQNGIVTAAVSTLFTFMRGKEFCRGFYYAVNPEHRGRKERLVDPEAGKRGARRADAEETNVITLPLLERFEDEQFFLFVHYWDAHVPYDPPNEYKFLFYDGDPQDKNNRSLEVLEERLSKKYPPDTSNLLISRVKGFLERHNTTDIDFVSSQYDAEVRYLDDKVTEFLEAIEETGLADDTVVIITADHGESMIEHDDFWNHSDVYEPTIHVPLIMVYPPEFPHGKRIKDFVQLVDIAPTILEVMGTQTPLSLQGRSLQKILRGESQGYGEVYCNQGLHQASRMIRRGEWKFVDIIEEGEWGPGSAYELYNLEKDPEENENLIESEREVADELQAQLTRWVDEHVNRRWDKLDPLRVLFTRDTVDRYSSLLPYLNKRPQAP